MNPEVITLDEPMNGIDPKGKRFFEIETVRRSNKNEDFIL
jgi:cobalt/nickel transport system ATP-binding protein